MSPRWGSTPRLTDRLTVSRNVTLTLTLNLNQSLSLEKSGVLSLQIVADSRPWWGGGRRGSPIIVSRCVATPSRLVR
jgi:hypothetical protein